MTKKKMDAFSKMASFETDNISELEDTERPELDILQKKKAELEAIVDPDKAREQKPQEPAKKKRTSRKKFRKTDLYIPKAFRIKPEVLELFENYAWENRLSQQDALEKIILKATKKRKPKERLIELSEENS